MSAKLKQKAFTYGFFLSVLMILVGAAIVFFIPDAESQNNIEFWGITLNTTNSGVAIAIVGFIGAISLLKKVFPAPKVNGEAPPFYTITINVEDKGNKSGVQGAEVKLKLPDGSKVNNSNRDGDTKFEIPSLYLDQLSSVEMTITHSSYNTLRKKIDIETDTVKSFKLEKKLPDPPPTPPDPPDPNLKEKIRGVLTEGFTRSGFDSFLMDKYPSVYSDSALESGREIRINKLLEYCESEENGFNKILDLLKDRASQLKYKKYFP